jgi:type IV pilus assembly protein PilB
VPLAIAERHVVVPLEVRGRALHLAMADPFNVDAIKDVEFRSCLKVRPVVTTPSQIRQLIARSYGTEETSFATCTRLPRRRSTSPSSSSATRSSI